MLILGEALTMTAPARVGAVLVRGERIEAVGSPADLGARYPGEPRLEVERITPGVHDAHAHPTLWGRALDALDLTGVTDPRDAAGRVADWAGRVPTGAWVRGGGYLFDGYPHRAVLDAVAPAHPVMVTSRDLHSAWVNGRALAAAGIDRDTPDPDGGRIVRGPDGTPTGCLLERAVALVERVVPAPDRADLERGLVDFAKRGYVAVHAMPFGAGTDLAWAEELAAAGGLPLRVWWAVPAAMAESVRPGARGCDLDVGGVKLFADGALGSRTAWTREPYAGGGTGMPLDSPDTIAAAARIALERGLSPTIHAIGTRAVETVLDTVADLPRRAGRPIRIEHAQHVRDEDVDRLAAAGVVVSMQPAHLPGDAALVRAVFPGRSHEAFRFADLAAAGARLAFGSDAPVVPPDLAAGMAAATRHALCAEQSLSTDQALRAFTAGAAAAAGWRDSGTIESGARADLALWEKDRLIARVWRGAVEEVGR